MGRSTEGNMGDVNMSKEEHEKWRRKTLWDRLANRDDDEALALLDLKAELAGLQKKPKSKAKK